MVRIIQRESGDFQVAEGDFLNCYYELACKGTPYAHVHIQLATVQKFAYCHAYVTRFTRDELREIRKDWAVIKDNARVFGIEKMVGTKIDGIEVWKKFLRLIGFKAENIRPSMINNEPCMMAVMEL